MVWNLIGLLAPQLKAGEFTGLPSGIRLFVPASGLFTYADVTIVKEAGYLDKSSDTLLNPVVLIEVLSLSTEAYDRGRKFEHYQTIPSLQEYLLVASDRVRLDLYTRQLSGEWLLSSRNSLVDSIELKSPGCLVALADVYRDVEFEFE